MAFVNGRVSALVLASLLSVGCSKIVGEPPTFSFSFTIRVTSDDGSPIQGAEIGARSSRVVRTDAAGHAKLTASGHEGDRRSFEVRCPKEFESPAQPLRISLRQHAEGAPAAVYGATCVPLKRTVVVAVRAEGGGGLPISYLDEEVARTDESGAAHFVLQVAPGEPFRVVIHTRDVDADLRPVDPTAELSVGPADDIVLVEQKLSRVARPAAPPRRARRTLPQKL